MPPDGSFYKDSEGRLIRGADGSLRKDCCCPAGCEAVIKAIPCRSEFDEDCESIRLDQWVCSDAVCTSKDGDTPISTTTPVTYYDSVLGYCYVTVPESIILIGKAPEGITPLTVLECAEGCNVEPCLESGEPYPESCQCICASRDGVTGDIVCCFGLHGDATSGGSWDVDYYRSITIHLTRTPIIAGGPGGTCPDDECLTGVEECLVYKSETRSKPGYVYVEDCAALGGCGREKGIETRVTISKLDGAFLCCSADNTGTNDWTDAGTIIVCIPGETNDTDYEETPLGSGPDGCEALLIEDYSDIGDCESRVVRDQEILQTFATANIDEDTRCVCLETQDLVDEQTWTYFNPADMQNALPICAQCQEEINRGGV